MEITKVKHEYHSPFTLTGNDEADIERAVECEHPCTDGACDIAAALRTGRPLVAAFLLSGATDTYLLDAVIWAHAFNGTLDEDPRQSEFLWSPTFDEWSEWFRGNTVKCESCEAYNFNDEDEPERCGNCLAELPATTCKECCAYLETPTERDEGLCTECHDEWQVILSER